MNPIHSQMYSIQHDVIKFVSDLRQVGGFLRLPSPIKLTVKVCFKILRHVELSSMCGSRLNNFYFLVYVIKESCINTLPFFITDALFIFFQYICIIDIEINFSLVGAISAQMRCLQLQRHVTNVHARCIQLQRHVRFSELQVTLVG